ncbi:hypothetical protein [Derxia gummosa]|uniref:Uncharacterized protein n=1 Tax=Derxia gummosa DSM 723 TaxID=1121388 RepID=A0A8B6X302_9BURK|nr:hypothetical protein [Derxia gummosa]
MQRLLFVRLHASGCAAEVWINDLPVFSVGPDAPLAARAVHEYVFEGVNRIELRVAQDRATLVAPVEPGGAGLVAAVPARAHLRLALVRDGRGIDDDNARVLAERSWAVAAGEAWDAPVVDRFEVSLPVGFQRWRWPEAPVIEAVDGVRAAVRRFLQQTAGQLSRGDAEPLLAISRVRIEETAAAYQRAPADELARLRAHLLRLHVAGALTVPAPGADRLVLRPCGDGRLLDCVLTDGGPALRALATPETGGVGWSLPVRIALVERHIHVLR